MPILGCPCAVAERALGVPIQRKGGRSGGCAMELKGLGRIKYIYVGER